MSDPNINSTPIPTSTTDAAVKMLTEMEAHSSGTTPIPQPIETSPTVDTSSVETISEKADPQPIDIAPDALVRIKVDGAEKTVKMSDYQEMLQRTDAYTQRSQALARQREELETHAAQRYAQLEHAAQQIALREQQLNQQANPLQQLLTQLQQSQGQQATKANPNEIATLGEVEERLKNLGQQVGARMQQQEQQHQQALAAKAQEVREQFEIAEGQKRFSEALNGVMKTEDGQLLSKLSPKAEAILRFETLKMGPENVDQAIEFLNQVSKGWVENVRGTLQEHKTREAVGKAKTVLEPPSGSTVPLQTKEKAVSLKKDGSIDWAALRAKAEAILDA